MGRPRVADRLVGVGGQDECLLLGLQALADPVRLQVVRLLAEREQCVCHLTEAFGLSQASISHHMAVLKRAGLVEVRRDARWTYYRLAPQAVSSLRESLDRLLNPSPVALTSAACCDELEDSAQPAESAIQSVPAPIPPVTRSDNIRPRSAQSRGTQSQETHSQ